ncbi:hypothetical protein [Streptomyces mirabilis]
MTPLADVDADADADAVDDDAGKGVTFRPDPRRAAGFAARTAAAQETR